MQSKCSRNELHIFSISKAWNELHKQWKKRKISSKPLEPMDGQGNQRSSQIWWRNKPELSPLSRAKNNKNKNKWAEWLGRGRGKRIRGPGAFCSGWRHQPVQSGQKGCLWSRLVPPTGTKDPYPPARPASRWTRDKSHLLSWAQSQPGQMAWKKCLFCSIL